jgi:hypothetical protein
MPRWSNPTFNDDPKQSLDSVEGFVGFAPGDKNRVPLENPEFGIAPCGPSSGHLSQRQCPSWAAG